MDQVQNGKSIGVVGHGMILRGPAWCGTYWWAFNLMVVGASPATDKLCLCLTQNGMSFPAWHAAKLYQSSREPWQLLDYPTFSQGLNQLAPSGQQTPQSAA